jgi:CRISPR-associated protein Cas5d
MSAFCLHVSGDFACFTRPEMKVERVSYDVITPSAARAIFEAILWKPAIRWHIEKIEVLKPIQWFSVRRNEVASVIPIQPVKTAMRTGTGQLALYADEDRQQRAGLILRDVAYRIHARFQMTDKAGPDDNPTKFAEMFRRRASTGQAFNQPYLGCREFSADVRLVTEANDGPPPIAETRELGWMLHDLRYGADKPISCFFNAKLDNGVVRVPAPDSAEIRG